MCGQRRGDKARVDHAHAKALGSQVHVEGLGQVRQRGLGGAIGQALWQTTEAGHAGNQTQVAMTLVQQAWQHGVEHVQRPGVVDRLVAQHF